MIMQYNLKASASDVMAVSMSFPVNCILWREGRPPHTKKKGCPGYDTKLHVILRLIFQLYSSGGVWIIHLLVLQSGTLKPKVVVPVRIQSTGLVDLFKNYWYWIGIHNTI